MASSSALRVVEEIDALTAIDDWAHLDELIQRYFALPNAARHMEVWFRLYERFPIDNGDDNKRFWSIMHGLEAQPEYEPLVLDSLRRRPADFPLLMVNRMLNADHTTVRGTDLISILRSVSENESCLPEVRQRAAGFLETQRQRRARHG